MRVGIWFWTLIIHHSNDSQISWNSRLMFKQFNSQQLHILIMEKEASHSNILTVMRLCSTSIIIKSTINCTVLNSGCLTCASITLMCSRNWEKTIAFSGSTDVEAFFVRVCHMFDTGPVSSASMMAPASRGNRSRLLFWITFNCSTRYATLLLDVACQSGSQSSCDNQHQKAE